MAGTVNFKKFKVALNSIVVFSTSKRELIFYIIRHLKREGNCEKHELAFANTSGTVHRDKQKNWPIADQRVSSNDARKKYGTHLDPSSTCSWCKNSSVHFAAKWQFSSITQHPVIMPWVTAAKALSISLVSPKVTLTRDSILLCERARLITSVTGSTRHKSKFSKTYKRETRMDECRLLLI